jgi:hypothetical protein
MGASHPATAGFANYLRKNSGVKDYATNGYCSARLRYEIGGSLSSAILHYLLVPAGPSLLLHLLLR